MVVVYPSAIARACSALDESPVFTDLPDGYVRVVLRLVKKINLSRLTAPILASRRALAEESGKSLETVGRAVKWLEDRGLVQRCQKARAGLRGSTSPIIPTEAFLEALLLRSDTARQTPAQETEIAESDARTPSEVARQTSSAAPSYPQPATGSCVRTDGSKSVNREPQQSFRRQPAAGAFVQIERVKLPSELLWLVRENGLRATAVLHLMKLARTMKQRLTDVVAVTRQYLQPLTGRDLFAYLRALVLKNRDYGFMANHATAEHQVSAERRRLDEKAEMLRGRRFRTRNGEIIVTVENSGILYEIRAGQRTTRRMDQSFLDAIDDGRLVPLREEVV